MEKDVLQQWDGVERRDKRTDRRGSADRRRSVERRFDFRNARPETRRSVKAWFRSLANARLGVDRRKGMDRRVIEDRRSKELRSLLTPEELADLLSE
ncbi:MAG TPA: hypothetical protein EYP35_04180 [Desulfobacterales bacterium]|nr:hypothetical protein [Desulfobacterales bacterium]HIP39474.1 hypothetical protein [Desulfocapsa sulfexigens]